MKRSADALDQADIQSRRQVSKRARLSPSTKKQNSSEPSSCSVSEDSALQSSPPASEHTRQSSPSSVQSIASDDESESSISDSSDESSAPEEEDEEVITIGGPKKPDMSDAYVTNGAEDVRARLSSLLPRLAEANQVLTGKQGDYNIEDVEDDEQHIEMDLGLGVLEERNDSDEDNTSEDSGDSGSEPDEDRDVAQFSESLQASPQARRANVMEKLLGQPVDREKAVIEDLG